MPENIVIKDVDTELLEEQRLQLHSILQDDSILSCLTAEQQDALSGVRNMLDVWSDSYFLGRDCE